jgi:outer membrane protein assembly factor BamB
MINTMKSHVRYALKLLVTGGFASLSIGMLCLPGLQAQGVLTWHNDLARTGQYPLETVLSSSNVTAGTFGLLANPTVDGPVDAEPLYVPGLTIASATHNVLYVVTENDSLYAFDADTGTQLWKHSVLLSGETASNTGCGQVSPTVGITSTPVIDLTQGANGTIYLVAMTQNGSNYYQRLHALDLVSGNEQSGWPVVVSAPTFVPNQYKERTGLLLSNGIVYTTWASNCDVKPYNSWIMGYNESTGAQVVLNMTPNGSQGGIWMAGAGSAADAGGNVYFLIGNGTFDTTLNASGFPNEGDYGNAFMNLSTITGIKVQDYFTMDNTVSESNGDEDLGSGGALLLPTLNDAMGNPHALAVGAGKDGNAYVVDRNNMGKFNMSSNAMYQEFSLGTSVFSSPAWFNNTLYYGPIHSPVAAYTFSDGKFTAPSTTSTSHDFGTNCNNTGGTPSISSSGTSNGIIWVADTPCNGGQVPQGAALYAYDAGTLTQLYSSTGTSIGTGVTFPTPMVANGKVYVGTSNSVAIFGTSGCSYSVQTTPLSVPEAGFSGGIIVPTTPSTGCPFSAATTANFITITSVSGGTVYLNIPANPGYQRTGTLIIAGHYVTVNQAGGTVSATAGYGFYTLSPCRVADTRSFGGKTGPFGPPFITGGTTRSFPIPASFCNVPSNVQAYSLNITVVPHTTLGFLTVWPANAAFPTVSTLNSLNGQTVANAAIVPAGTDAAISVYASDDTDVFIDINGYFASPSSPQALAFYPLTPCRVADTRSFGGFTGAFGPPTMTAGEARDFPMTSSSCNIPSSAQAYALNMTVSPATTLEYLTTWPTGGTFPIVSTLNDLSGGLLANAAIVPAGTNGDIEVYVTNVTDVIIDINGYFAPPGNAGALYFYPLTPCRVADTRSYGGFTGSFGPPSMGADTARDFPVLSSPCTVAAQSAQAYSLNITGWPPGTPLEYITVWPVGQAFPTVSTLNAPSGQAVANAAIVPAGTNGAIDIFASNATDVFFDINGYFAP